MSDWQPITAERADELLNILPPIYFPGGFAVGEAVSFVDGAPTFACVVEVSGRHYTRDVRRTDFAREAAALRIRLAEGRGA